MGYLRSGFYHFGSTGIAYQYSSGDFFGFSSTVRSLLGEADEVRQMHEAGELGNALQNCQTAAAGKGVGVGGCGDVRLLPCETCSGSCKVYVEEEEEEEEEENGGGWFRRCPDCNENGLVRCPLCC